MKARTQNTYRQHLRPLLPREAFQPNPRKLISVAVNLALAVGCIFCLSLNPSIFETAVLVLLIGHLFAANGFLAHEVSHGNVIRNRRGRYVLELVTWLPVMISPAMWHRLHNVAHHAHVNTVHDPDRRFLLTDAGSTAPHFARHFYPNSEIIAWTPLPFLYFLPYLVRNNAAAFLRKPLPISHTVPQFSRRDRTACAGEWVLLISVHAVFFALAGFSITFYLTAFIYPVIVASVIFVSFVATQHWLNPIHDVADPLLGSTSVRVPRVIDAVYHNVSWHTEHHLFPQLNPDWYPAVGRLLKQHYGEHYNSISMGEAWRRLWRSARFAEKRQQVGISSIKHKAPVGD